MTPTRIYVACLASYNAGILHGVWLDTDGYSADDLQVSVNEMLEASSVPDAEEWAIHDHEGFGGLLGEHDSFERVVELSDALNEHGEAFLAYLEVFGQDADVSKFSDAYRGEWDSEKAFAEDWAVESGLIDDQHPMFSYIDWEHYWNADLKHSFSEHNGYFFYCD